MERTKSWVISVFVLVAWSDYEWEMEGFPEKMTSRCMKIDLKISGGAFWQTVENFLSSSQMISPLPNYQLVWIKVNE